MSRFFKSKYKVVSVVALLMAVVTLISVAFAQGYISLDRLSPNVSEPAPTPDPEPETHDASPVELEEESDSLIPFHIPSDMRGAVLTPGEEFLTDAEATDQQVSEELDTALEDMDELGLNTVIFDTTYGDQVLFQTEGAPSYASGYDLLEDGIQRAREKELYVYALIDLSVFRPEPADGDLLPLSDSTGPSIYESLYELADTYDVDGLLFTGYQYSTTPESYQFYATLGGGMGYNSYMRQTPEAMVRSATQAVRQSDPSIQIGLLVDPVWANAQEEPHGSDTAATYTALTHGNADTRRFVQEELVDFVMVNAYGAIDDPEVPFQEIAQWWTELSQPQNTSVYFLQASSKAGTWEKGWSPDQLVKQMEVLEEFSGIDGVAYDSLNQLVADPGGSTTQLQTYFVKGEEVEEELILQELEMTKPAQTSFTTTETQVVFTGASDPEQPVSINDTVIPTDQSGYFTATYPLQPGANTFTVVHKDRTVTYEIIRQVNILTGVSPTGNIVTDGGMKIKIYATAYEGSTVTAQVGGASLTLTQDDNALDEADRDSSYRVYSGVYTAPAATASVQNLGSISITANWQGESKTLTGATITVNKKAKVEDGVPVVVTASQAKTYPVDTLDNIPRADCYPLPQGAMDYAVGNAIDYKGVSYTVLAGGHRVRTQDISTSTDYASGNAVQSLSVTTSGGYTYVTLETTQKISYVFNYTSSGLSIDLNNTVQVPDSTSLTKNPLFSAANWSGSTLTLALHKQGGFLGYKAYYNDDGNLVFRFNNTPSSYGGARVVIDPGHGGRDVGALGFLADYPEKVLNQAIAEETAAELQRRGATVLLLDTSGGMTLEQRLAQAENFGAHFYISIHNNTAPNPSARGTEVFYHYPYSHALAGASSSQVSSQLGTTNRGAKQSYYHVTLSPQFSSVLVECGFMSNREEYEKLIRPKYHVRIAGGIADGVGSAIHAANTGVGASGSENAGGNESGVQPPADTSVALNLSRLDMKIEQTEKLIATTQPAGVSVDWSSSNRAVARVDGDGNVTAIGAGDAVITAQTASGELATCRVRVTAETVAEEIPVKEVLLTPANVELAEGETFQLKAQVQPANATDKQLIWRSSQSSVASVNNRGLITAVKPGETTITVTTRDGGYQGESVIVVADNASDLDDIAQITIEGTKESMTANSQQTLRVVTDRGKTVPSSQLIWSSSNSSVASVNSSGVVRAGNQHGSTVITVRTRQGDLEDRVTITVFSDRMEIDELELSHQEIAMTPGEINATVKAHIYPEEASGSPVRWSTANRQVATVDSRGVVTAKGKGTTTLIVRAQYGGAQATCRIVVTD